MGTRSRMPWTKPQPPQHRPLWPGSGPSEQAVRRRLRRTLGREPSPEQVRAATLAASTAVARQMLAQARSAP